MISTFQALAVALLFVLPGAAYTFALERVVGSFGVALADRLLRFLAASAVFQAAFAGIELSLYREYVASGQLGRADVDGWLLQVVALSYVIVPTLVGSLVGYGQKRRWPWVRLLTGSSPEPRAWDYLWRLNASGITRVRLKSGTWLAGVYGTTTEGRDSYAAGYTEDADLYLSKQLAVDADTGAFIVDNAGQHIEPPGSPGLLLRWAEIEFLDFMEIR